MKFHKILIEVDVESDSTTKSEKISEILTTLKKAKCIQNISGITYISTGEAKKYEIDLKE